MNINNLSTHQSIKNKIKKIIETLKNIYTGSHTEYKNTIENLIQSDNTDHDTILVFPSENKIKKSYYSNIMHRILR